MQRKIKINITALWGAILSLLVVPKAALAMHITEGILPAEWAIGWFLVAAPFVAWGLREVKARSQESPHYKAFLGMVGAAIFIISCMPVPVPVVGSTAHPCGVGLAVTMIGVGPTIVISSVALFLQALFLAHGGLTTLGGNIVSMGVVGVFAAYFVFKGTIRLGLSPVKAAFCAGLAADWFTYAMTSLELALALSGPGDFWELFSSIALAFVPTQLPLGILEGFITAGAYHFVMQRRPELMAVAGEVV